MSMPPQQFCVRWNSYHTNLQTVFPKLLTTENFVDVTLACENRQIKCHKVVLSACSTYFERLLIQNPCKHPIIFMKDMRFSEMQSLVDFMYKGEVNVSQDDLPSLLKSAEALQIRGLCGTENSNSNQESPPASAPAPPAPHPTSCNASVNTSPSPRHQQDASTNSKSCLQPQSPNPYSNQSASPSSNGTQRSEKRRREDSPDTCKLKQETVEEDGLYYGDMECGQQDEEDLLQTGNVSGQQVSGNKKQQPSLRVKSQSELFKRENDLLANKYQTKENKKSILAEKLNQRIRNKQMSDYDPFSNHFLGNFLQTGNQESSSEFLDEKIFENEDYLKMWLEHNQELEVSMSHATTEPDLKIKKNLKKQPLITTNKETKITKTWGANPFTNNFLNIDQKTQPNELKPKNKKKGDKYMGVKKVPKGVDGVDLLDFVEPGDLDQFLAGKEVSSSGLSRTAVEQAMLGKYNPNRRYSNEAMWAALMDVKKGGSIYRAAQTHKVPRKSLRNWMKRWHIKSSFPMPQQLKQFVENNRKTKEELRRELTNSLLNAINKDKVNIAKDENNMDTNQTGNIDEVEKNINFENEDVILNLKMDIDRDCDESQDEAVDLRQEKQTHSIDNEDNILNSNNTNAKEMEEKYDDRIIDMSGNVLYDENMDVPIKNIDYNVVSNPFTHVNVKPKNTDKKIVSFSNVEQLAGIQSEN